MPREHLDEHAGKAGTFINDPETGRRLPIEDYQAAQAAKTPAQAVDTAKASPKKPSAGEVN
jgi:hypothetical protein